MDISLININKRTSSHGTPAEWVLRGLAELKYDPDGLGPSCAKTRWHSMHPGNGDAEWAKLVEDAADKGWIVVLAFVKDFGNLWAVYSPEEAGKLGIGQRRHHQSQHHHHPKSHRHHKGGGGGKGRRR